MPDEGTVFGACVLCTPVFGICLIVFITVMASRETLGPEEQMLVEYLDGKKVYNGPLTMVFNPFRDRELRKATRLSPTQFCRIKNTLNGSRHSATGPQLVFLNPYDELEDGVKERIVLTKDQYIRYKHRIDGTEQVFRGPRTVVPDVWQESSDGIQQAPFINTDSAVLVINMESSEQKLVAPPGVTGEGIETATSGVYFPVAYEVVLERRRLIRVLPHETMIVRAADGLYRIVSGADGDGTGTAFFLPPYSAIVTQQWSRFSTPVAGESGQQISTEEFDAIDMRARKVFFQYDVRTNDNVNLLVEGTIFWQIVDVGKMIKVTADPAGDVWHHARSALIQSVSNITLQEFTEGFKIVVNRAFHAQKVDGFFFDRGLDIYSMEVTKYEPVDADVATTLELIIRERVNRINRMQVQQSLNDVAKARVDADIALELTRETLITTQANNERLTALMEGESEGTRLATSATSFIDGLASTLPDLSQRMELYKLHKKMEDQNLKTQNIASGLATVFLSPAELNINLKYNNTEL